jgi:hypothetical protein
VRAHPDDAHLTRVRKDQLKAMMDDVVNNALSLGYPAEEIRVAFEVELARWVRQRRSTASSRDARPAEPKVNLALQKE